MPKTKVDATEVERRVKEYLVAEIASNMDPSQIRRGTALVKDLGADSLDLVQMVLDLEEKFDVEVPDDQAKEIQTVGAVVDLIVELLEQKNAVSQGNQE